MGGNPETPAPALIGLDCTILKGVEKISIWSERVNVRLDRPGLCCFFWLMVLGRCLGQRETPLDKDVGVGDTYLRNGRPVRKELESLYRVQMSDVRDSWTGEGQY